MAYEKRPSAPGGARRRFTRRKGCRYCADSALKIDYKETKSLRYFISERGKIVPRRISGNCAEHQRKVNEAIKLARNIALLPFTAGQGD
ncbi:MAG: 30S ribosomal protein S18 [Desulfuromonadales bacterium]|jgi:small subunit ribosomal protein S18|nr:30S ribosomal protein S18 [Desulfuromonadales bacterium]MDO9080963.1 30S ribosomal protein S18 [Desulfuromonadales bacterium]MDZ4185322.1 30S ribosomal protein S18 [Desulfuromonadales bacterium]PKN11702.1 MAG: 30S ribosomal protein S18 [Deltaproteobacteria bacterium HGW-Deltaproteobacteria-4]